MKRTILIAAIASIFILTFSCDHGPMGIYRSLEVETDVTDNDTLENEITIGSMAKLGSSYYVAAGTVYSREEELASDWGVISPPSGYLISSDLAVAFGKVFAVFATEDGSESVLHSYDGSEWSTISDSDITEARCDALVVVDNGTPAVSADDTIFVSIRSGVSDYSIYYSTDGTSFAPVTTPVLTSPVTDGASWSDTNFWLTSRDMLLTGTTADTLTENTSYPGKDDYPDDPPLYGGIFYSTLLSVPFVSTQRGESSKVYAYSAGTWVASGVNDSNFRDFSELTISGKNVVVVGSESGYKELVFDGTSVGTALTLITPGLDDSGSVTTNSNYLNTDLASTVIGSFLTDTVSGETYLFACTSGQGLWINFYQDPERVWGRE